MSATVILLGHASAYREHFHDGALIASLLHRRHLFVASVHLPPFVIGDLPATIGCIHAARSKAQRAIAKMVNDQEEQ